MESLRELFDFAMAKEDEAAAFYEFLAAESERENVREVFRELAAQERAHKKVFEKILTGPPAEGKRKPAGADLHISDYLVDVTFSPSMSYQDTLILAMKREEKAVALYRDLAGAVPEAELSAALSKMAAEEAKHKSRLEALYDRDILTED